MKNSIILRQMLLLNGAVLLAGCTAMQPVTLTDPGPAAPVGPPSLLAPDTSLYMHKNEDQNAKLGVWFDRVVALASLASLSLYAAGHQ
jgi:hypothetical protein